jgi:regulator of replication initiation timing
MINFDELAALRERAKEVCEETKRLRVKCWSLRDAMQENTERIRKWHTKPAARRASWILDL